MSVIWNSEEINKVISVKNTESLAIEGIEIDSRKVKKGDLFCAMPGSVKDGHNFISNAFDRGAVAALAMNRPLLKYSKPVLIVKSVPKALNDIAKAARLRSKADIIAVTGSVGKTGTKEMLKSALNIFGNIHASKDSLNNHVGVPLSLARMPASTQYSILELGMNNKGEIANLTKIARPHIAIITAVEKAHFKNFINTDEIAKAKAEIFLGLDSSGTAIINRDIKNFKILENIFFSLGLKNIITFGESKESNIRLLSFTQSENNSLVKAEIFGKLYSWSLPVLGKHWGINSLIIPAVAKVLELNFTQVLKGLRNFSLPVGRGAISKINFKNGQVQIIDDSYNANPASVNAAIIKLGSLKNTGRKILVLGDMLELGEDSSALHLELLEVIENTDISLVFTVGKYMKKLFSLLPLSSRGKCVLESKNFSKVIFSFLKPEDVILVKGSNGMNMSSIANEIQILNEGK